MKKAFLLLCALLLVLGSALPLAGYQLAGAVLGRRADVAPSPASSAVPAAPEAAPAAYEGDADLFLIEDSTTGEVQQVPKRDYLIGAAAAEMPLSWPDEALKAQIVAAHSYALSAAQTGQLLSEGLGIAADPAAPGQWFGEPTLTASGYVASLPVCGQTVSGAALRRALGLRSACFTLRYQDGGFCITTRGYGHGVGLSQWGAKALAEQGQGYADILAHYFPGTQLCR